MARSYLNSPVRIASNAAGAAPYAPTCAKFHVVVALDRRRSPGRLRRVRWLKTMTVHDPGGFSPRVVGKRLAPRPDRLDGKISYLVDCLFDNTDMFMEEMRQWFAKHLPSVAKRVIRPRESWVDDPEMRATVARRAGRHSRRRFMKHLLPHGRGIGIEAGRSRGIDRPRP